jgi:hypothetical protein
MKPAQTKWKGQPWRGMTLSQALVAKARFDALRKSTLAFDRKVGKRQTRIDRLDEIAARTGKRLNGSVRAGRTVENALNRIIFKARHHPDPETKRRNRLEIAEFKDQAKAWDRWQRGLPIPPKWARHFERQLAD